MASNARAKFRLFAAAAMTVGWLAMGGPGSAATAAESSVRATYDIYFGGLHMAEAEASLTLNATDYSLDLVSRLRGITSVFSGWRLAANSEGSIGPNGVSPLSHMMAQSRGGDTDTVRMRFDQGQLVDHTNIPERDDPEQGDEDHIPSADLQDVVDPVSAMIVALHAVDSTDWCQGRAPVFDGRRRFDIVFNHIGLETLETSRYTSYSGPATRCRVHLELVSGAFKSEDSDSFWRRGADPSDRQMDVWFGRPMAGGPIVPVRMQGDTRFGRFLVHLRNAVLIGQ